MWNQLWATSPSSFLSGVINIDEGVASSWLAPVNLGMLCLATGKVYTVYNFNRDKNSWHIMYLLV